MNLRRKHALTVAVAGHQAQARLPAPSTDRDPCCHAGDAVDCGRQDSAAASEPFLFIGVLSQHDSAGESQRLKAQRRCKGTELDDVMCQPVQHTACVCSVLESADSNTVCLEVSLLTQAMGRCQSHSPYLCRCPSPVCPPAGQRQTVSLTACCLPTCSIHSVLCMINALPLPCLPGRQCASSGRERRHAPRLLLLPAMNQPLVSPTCRPRSPQVSHVACHTK